MSSTYTPVLPRFRSRWAVGVQITAMISMILQPLTVNSFWSDTDGNGAKDWVEDPPAGDSWWDQDSDGDLMTNAEEALFGSDPYRIDSDFDGLTDKDERDLGPLFSGGMPSDPWLWSSAGGGVSDYDAYYQYLQNIVPQVNYQTLAANNTPFFSYFDADGDGTQNPFDAEPLGNDIDGDGLLNWQDSHMADPYNGAGPPTQTDSDGDGILDSSDPFPYGSYTYNGVEYGGTLVDADNDGVPDPADPFPNGSYTYGGVEYGGYWIDSDNDGIPDPADSTPFPPNSYWYNGTQYFGQWEDDDGDGVPNPADYWPNDTWNGQPHYTYNGSEYAGEWSDRDADAVPDPADAWPDDADNNADNDGDGLSNYEESTQFHTNPGAVDSDQDFLTDYEELFVFNTNPVNPRSADGVRLDWEVMDHVDNDADGIPNRIEAFYGLNANDAMDAHGDLDGDGVSNLTAYQSGLSLTLNTNHYDMDDDVIPDVVEDYWASVSPGLMSKSDPDDATADPDNDGVLNYEEVRYGLNPTLASTNGTATDLAFVNMSFGLKWQRTRAPGDTDGDGMSDRFEHRYGKRQHSVSGLNLRDAKDAGRDPDQDHLSSLNEFRFDSHPLAKETWVGSNGNTLTVSNDNTRFHTRTPASAAGTGGGLLGRYRAQIAADLARPNTTINYSFQHTPLPTICEPGSSPESSPEAKFSLGNVVRKYYSTDESSGTAPIRTEPQGSQSLPGTLTSGSTPGGSHSCGTVDCPACEGGYKNTNCPNHGNTGNPCGMDHFEACPVKVLFCPGHFESRTTCGFENNPDHVHDLWTCYTLISVDCLENGECSSTTCQICNGTGFRRVGPCDSSCVTPAPPCEDSRCTNGILRIPCEEEYCDGGDRTDECACGNDGCICCDPEDDSCEWADSPGEKWEEEGQVTVSELEPGDTRRYRILSNGAEVDVLSINKTTVSVGPAKDEETLNIEKELIDDSIPNSSTPPVSLCVADGAGSRYRKIGLNGLPISDSKPQIQDESGELPEETYVDAYTRQLRHSVTDVYEKADGCDIPLLVRRDAATTITTEQRGLKIHENPTLPFGAGWSSNLCSYVKIDQYATTESDPDKAVNRNDRAVAVDEQGATQSFVKDNNVWKHSGEEILDVKTQMNQFIYLDPVILLRKKYGTECTYERTGIVQKVALDRYYGSKETVTTTYYRLTEVRDRLGNRLCYTYPSSSTLIPSKIVDPERPGRWIQIAQEMGRVTAVMAPGGGIVEYVYDGTENILTTVTRGGGTVSYEYESMAEAALPPVQIPPPPCPEPPLDFNHVNLFSIQDELGRKYSFQREFDQSVKHTTVSQDSFMEWTDQGLPRLVTMINAPTGAVAISGLKLCRTENAQVLMSPAFTLVHAVDGARYRYDFDKVSQRIYSEDFTYSGRLVSQSLLATFTQMVVRRSKQTDTALLTTFEQYKFNPEASMALAEAMDSSGNKTVYEYGEDRFDDPVREIRYLKNLNGTETEVIKSFTYDQNTRIMTSMTDPERVRTVFDIDNSRTVTRNGMVMAIQGLKTAEKVYDKDGGLVHETRFYYDHPVFCGLMTRKWDISPVPSAMPSGLTLIQFENSGAPGYSGDWSEPAALALIRLNQANSNVCTPGWWREVTTSSGPATSAGLLASVDSETTTIHDMDGRKRTVIDPNQHLTNFEYDQAGHLRRINHPDGSSKALGYDAHGNVISETDENGVDTFYAYDSLNRRVKTAVDLNGNDQPDWFADINRRDDPSYTTILADPETGAPVYDGDLVTTTGYNARGQPVALKDARGNYTVHDYDGLGRIIATTAGGHTTSYYYEIPGSNDNPNTGSSLFDSSSVKPCHTIDARNVITDVVYDSLYRAVKTTVSRVGYPGEICNKTEYDLCGRPVMVTDPLNRETKHLYDSLGQCVKTTFPDNTPDNILDNTFVEQFYTHHGQVWKSINEMKAETVTTYDALGRAVSVTQPPAAPGEESAVMRTGYDAAGNVLQVTDPLGRVTYSTYDERNRPVSIYAARVWDSVHGSFVWPEAVTTYDDAGRVLSVKDHTGATVRKAYDAAGRVWKSTDPLNHDTFSTYDPNGNVLTVTDARNNTTTNTYDALNRLRTTQDGEDIVNKFEYDAAGNRTKVIDGLNQETSFVYDLLGRLKSQTFANLDTWTYAYNAVHKLSQTDPNEVTTSYTYHDRGWLETSTAPGLARTYSYDDCGRLLSVTEADRPEATVVNTYDALGRLKTETSRGVPHTYSYDLVGNRVRAEYGTGQVIETSYDALNRPETITQGEQMTRYGYDLAGRAVMLIGGNGQVTENTYDVAGRLVNRVLFRSLMERANEDVMAEFGWAHDAVGNVVAQHEVWPGSADRAAGVRMTTMTYDGANRLETESITDPEQGVIATTYAYDDANNRDTKTVTGGSEPGFWDYTYNGANQLKAWEKRSAPAGTLIKSASLTYDLNGNRTSQTITEGAETKLTGYAWDAQDRLSAVTVAAGVSTPTTTYHYDYDYRTRRTGTHETSTASAPKHTTIVFAGGLSLAEWETENSEPITANPPTVEYTRGPDMGGGVGGMLYSKRGETHKYSLSNGRGDIVAQSDSAGALTWTASYEAYGKRTKETGTNADKQRANTKDEDPTGLLNEGFRYRDIETGVWLSRDPAGFVDGPNLYAYVMQNPWTHWDPDGLKVPENQKQAKTVADAIDRKTQQLHKDTASRDNFSRIAADDRMEGSWLQKRAKKEMARLDAKIESTAKDIDYHSRSLQIYSEAVESGDGSAIVHANNLEKSTGSYDGGGMRETAGDLAEIYGAVGLVRGVLSFAEKSLLRFAKTKCFAAGTNVQTPDGGKNIEDIKVGDIVYAFDFETKKAVERRVLETVSNFTHYWADVEVAGDVLQATRGHKFWVESENEWIDAAALTPGMIVRLSDGRTCGITKVTVRALSAPETTYNLIVEDEHNYFVGMHHVLVHNGYPESPQYPGPTAVGETFQFNFDTSKNYGNSRAAGRERARAAGVLKPNEIGHHINSVQTHPHLAAEPSNFAPEASRTSHFNTHGNNWHNPTSGPLNAACP